MKLVIDTAERAVATFLETFLGLLIVSGLFDQLAIGHWAEALSSTEKAAIAAVPAGLAVIKGLLSHFVGDPTSAAALPASVEHPAP